MEKFRALYEVNFVKKLYLSTHVRSAEMNYLLRDAGSLTLEITDACEQVYGACVVFEGYTK